MFGIFPIVEEVKNVTQFTLLNPQMMLTTGDGIMGIKRQVRIATKEFRLRNSSYSWTFG
jgi:hypothetical protein